MPHIACLKPYLNPSVAGNHVLSTPRNASYAEEGTGATTPPFENCVAHCAEVAGFNAEGLCGAGDGKYIKL